MIYSDIKLQGYEVTENYEECNLAVLSENNETIIKKLGLKGIIVLTHFPSNFPNTFYISSKNLNYYIKFVEKNREKIKDLIIESTQQYKEKRSKVICFIPVYQRHHILKKTINSVKRQTHKTDILCVVSNEADETFCQSMGVKTVFVENRPLGRKFQMGLEFCKIFYPDKVLLLGSDDFLMEDYVEKMVNYEGDLIGRNQWYLYGTAEKTLYSTTYERTIGAGRIFGYEILNKLNWKLFPTNRNQTLDLHSARNIINAKGKINVIKDVKTAIISYKDTENKVKMINSLAHILKKLKCQTCENTEIVEYIESL